MYSRELLDDILKNADIVSVISSYIPVTKKGKEYLAVCPFHADNHPSLHISKEKQVFKCFVDGTGGNAFRFVEKYENVSFTEAVRKVASIIGYDNPQLREQTYVKPVNPSKVPLYACINDLQLYYRYALGISEGSVATEYLTKRGISQADVEKYGIGYSPLDGGKTVDFLKAKGHSLKSIEDIGIALAKSEGMADHNAGRLIFPLCDADGQIVGFSARRLLNNDTAKYVNSPETPIFEKSSLLYNYHIAKNSARHDGYIYILEGFMDVMSLGRAGINSAVALMGTSFSKEQISLLRRLNCELRLCLDGDDPGQTAMMKMISQLNGSGLHFRLVDNCGDQRDPDDIYVEEGEEGLKKAMGKLIDPFDFQLNFYQRVKKLSTSEEKRKVMLYFTPYLRGLEPGIEKENYLVKLSQATGYQIEAIRNVVNERPSGSLSKEEIDYQTTVNEELLHPEKKPLKRLFLAEREILFYMMKNPEAVDYFIKNIDAFYYPMYEEIANYVISYVSERKSPVDLALLLGDIQNSGCEDPDAIESKVAEILNDDCHPPYSEKVLNVCAEAIQEEKQKIHDEEITGREMSGVDDTRKALALAEYARKKALRLKQKSKKGSLD